MSALLLTFASSSNIARFLLTLKLLAKGALQEFDVSTDMFGNIVPEMQSISLAIDSNWGLEYSCLYRFRVHGDAIGFDESSDDDDDSDD